MCRGYTAFLPGLAELPTHRTDHAPRRIFRHSKVSRWGYDTSVRTAAARREDSNPPRRPTCAVHDPRRP